MNHGLVGKQPVLVRKTVFAVENGFELRGAKHYRIRRRLALRGAGRRSPTNHQANCRSEDARRLDEDAFRHDAEIRFMLLLRSRLLQDTH